jgi:hypothetical protein
MSAKKTSGQPNQGGDQTGQFGEVDQTGQGTDLTRQMESAGPNPDNTPGTPKGGGQGPTPAAGGSDHDMRLPGESTPAPGSDQTWQGGSASQEAMRGSEDFGQGGNSEVF